LITILKYFKFIDSVFHISYFLVKSYLAIICTYSPRIKKPEPDPGMGRALGGGMEVWISSTA
jgi:hypothetical protein